LDFYLLEKYKFLARRDTLNFKGKFFVEILASIS